MLFEYMEKQWKASTAIQEAYFVKTKGQGGLEFVFRNQGNVSNLKKKITGILNNTTFL